MEAPIPPAREAGFTLSEQLATHYGERIRRRELAPGARLPSVRECARRHQVSPSTVVAAYDRLLAAGLVQSLSQRGFFVRDARGEGRTEPVPAARGAPAPPLPVSATTLIRGMFQPPGGKPMPALGTLPPEWLDPALLGRALRQAGRGERFAAHSLVYGDPAGSPRLRAALVRQLAEAGIGATETQIVTTVGATQALDIVTRTLLRPGEPVLVDEPGWAVEYARLAALGQRVLPVPRGDDGPDLEVMARLIEAHRPRLYVTVSVLHNPTGASLSLHAAHRLLQLAQAHSLTIVEDDTYAHLADARAPRLAALDGLQRTVYVSGFSKILVPAWRVGFLAAPAMLVERLTDTKLLTTLSSPAITEEALAFCLDQGLLRRHAERVRQRLDAARSRAVALAERHGFAFAAAPRGMFGWVDAGVDTERAAEALLAEGWLIAPGALFHAVHRPTTLLRINFATSQAEAFWQTMRRVCDRLADPERR